VYYDVPVASPVPTMPPVPDTTRHDSSATRRRLHPDGPRFPSATAENGERMPRRFAPRDGRDLARERPVVASGLRFRPPEQLPSDGGGTGLFMTRHIGDSPARRTPTSSEGPSMRRATDRQDTGDAPRRMERPASRPRESHTEPARLAPARAEAPRPPATREPGHVTPAKPDPR
jgi:hypothetical protein